jgi:hypothetical protein
MINNPLSFAGEGWEKGFGLDPVNQSRGRDTRSPSPRPSP